MIPDADKFWCINWPNGQIQAINPRTGSLDNSVIAGGFVNVSALLFDRQCNQAFFAADYNIYVVGEMGTFDAIHFTDDNVTSLAVMDDTLYYTAYSDAPSGGYIVEIDLSGLECARFHDLLNRPSNLVADRARGRLYYTDVRGGKVIVAWMNIQDRSERIIATFDSVSELCFDKGKLYVVCPDHIAVVDGDRQHLWYTGSGLRSLAFVGNDMYVAASSDGNHVIVKLDRQLTPVNTTIVGRDVAGGEPSGAVSSLTYSKATELSASPARHAAFIHHDRKRIGVIDLDNIGPVKWQLRSDILDNITGIAVGQPVKVENRVTSCVYLCNGESEISPPANSLNYVYIGGESSLPLSHTMSGGPRCVSVDEAGGLVFYSTANEIVVVHLENGIAGHQKVIINRGLGYTDVSSCVWDPLEKRLWWCATKKGLRGVFATDVKGKTEKTSERHPDSPSAAVAISIDPFTRTIYWIGSGGSIYLSSYNGVDSEIVRPKYNPQHIATDGSNLFWSASDGICALSLDSWNSRYIYDQPIAGLAVG